MHIIEERGLIPPLTWSVYLLLKQCVTSSPCIEEKNEKPVEESVFNYDEKPAYQSQNVRNQSHLAPVVEPVEFSAIMLSGVERYESLITSLQLQCGKHTQTIIMLVNWAHNSM